ncbi:hypothetical protein BEP19_16155 [Ammoniphilus oxalaticus]|uniref:precorrin-2 dehydrogenase n=2 Tax=Ammoniphilus oxalaticus TaxID=66863 RepID=A0A419SQU2_9BACL|nr:hypothetical protein BEP19_16155 [Ammoniphilus oxalaticus]
MLNIQGKDCLVVGAGAVAERKLKKLLAAKAKVRVVSPQATPTIRGWAQQEQVEWVKRTFQADDARGATLIVAATDQAEVNIAVYETVKPQQWINIADRPDLSTFIFPAVLTRGDLQLSISTAGAYPGLAKHLRKKLEREYGLEYGSYLTFLKEVRQQILSLGLNKTETSKLLRMYLDERYVEAAKEGVLDELEQAALEELAILKNKPN